MALSNATVFEVRTTGSDNNGGGFVTGASGTDYSQQTTAQYALTSLHSVGAGTTILTTSASSDMVGNLINITAGTNFTTGVFQITAVSVGVSLTVDRAVTTGAGASGTGNVGGCFATIGKASGLMTVTGMQTYVKATASYSISAGITSPAGISPALGICRIIGYNATRGDLGRPTIITTAAITALTDANGGFRFENFIVNGNLVGTNGMLLSGNYNAASNCLLENFLNYGVGLNGGASTLFNCEITGCGGATNAGAVVGLGGNAPRISRCYIHGNTTTGINMIGNFAAIYGNIIANNTGASSDGIQFNAVYSGVGCPMTGNLFYANGRDGIRSTGNYNLSEISGNLFINNVGIGLNTSAMTPIDNDVLIHHNAYFGNGTARSGNNTGVGDVTLTGNPCNVPGSGDFSLNNTAGAGAACRSVGFPGTFAGGLSLGYEDIGPLRHQDPSGGSGSMLVHPGMTGGAHG